MSDTNQEKLLNGYNEDEKQLIDHVIKKEFEKIFDTLLVPSSKYDPDITLQAIAIYMDKYSEFNVVYYSIISNKIFFSKDVHIEYIYTNIEICLSKISNVYRIAKDNNDADMTSNLVAIYRFVIKMVDHISLATTQVGKISGSIIIETEKVVQETKKEVNTTLKEQSDKDKDEMKKYYKGLEKDSITIMGMFVAIVLAFTGSIIIPTNLVNNAANIGSAKLVLLLSGVAFIFINLLYQLIRFILIINDKSVSIKKLYDISVINVILIVVFASSLFFL